MQAFRIYCYHMPISNCIQNIGLSCACIPTPRSLINIGFLFYQYRFQVLALIACLHTVLKSQHNLTTVAHRDIPVLPCVGGICLCFFFFTFFFFFLEEERIYRIQSYFTLKRHISLACRFIRTHQWISLISIITCMLLSVVPIYII